MRCAASSKLPITEVVAYDVDRRPGAWVTAQAARRSTRVWLLAALLVVLAVAPLGLLVSKRGGLVTSLVGLALVVAVRRFADCQADDALRWLGGAAAERRVGGELDSLRCEGFVVMHDIEQSYEGNVDHLVSGPTGVFMVETKQRRYKEGDLVKARRQAAKIHDDLGVWVTPVICRPGGDPFRTQGVWIVPPQRLLDWIRSQRSTPVAFERLARYADRL